MISVISLYQTPFSMTKSSFQANPSGYTVAFNVYVGKIFWNYLWSTTHWRLWATIGHQLIVGCKKNVCAPRKLVGVASCFFWNGPQGPFKRLWKSRSSCYAWNKNPQKVVEIVHIGLVAMISSY
jgi:hypothetical protein